jgi:hypothetical protein
LCKIDVFSGWRFASLFPNENILLFSHLRKHNQPQSGDIETEESSFPLNPPVSKALAVAFEIKDHTTLQSKMKSGELRSTDFYKVVVKLSSVSLYDMKLNNDG